MNKNEVKKKNVVLFIIAVVSVIAAIIFWKRFIRGSDFSWTTQQTVFWDSVAETCLIFSIFFYIFYAKYSKTLHRVVAVALTFSVFAYLHAYLVVLLAVIIYAFVIFLTGHLLTRLVASNSSMKDQWHFKFVLGMAGVICIVSLLSAIKCGTPEMLRRILPVVFALEIILSWKDIVKWIRSPKTTLDAPAEEYGVWNAALMAVILTGITIEVCKGNLGTDYDSAWYGFRSQYVLAPETGIYDKNILMCCVYTYPKGIEVLSLVFSGLSSYGYFNALNLVFAVLTLHAAYEMGKMVAKKQHALLMVAFIALTPSIMNMSLTAKSDLSTIYMQIVGLMFAIYAIKSKQSDYLVASMGVLILTLGFKPSSIVFTTIVVGIIILFAICLRIRPRLNDLSMLILPVAAVSCLFIRTAIITGYPITSIVTSVFKSLGFYPLYPYTLSSVRTTSLRTLLTTNLFWERLRRLIKLFFYPNSSDIYTLEMTWWGPMFSVLWIIALATILVFPVKTWKRVKNSNVECFITVSFLVISAASGGCMLLLETPDGNYFMLMQVVTYLFIATRLATLEKNLAPKCIPPAVLLGLCNLLLCLTISAAWMVGFTPIDLKNYGYYNHQSKYLEPMMEKNGLSNMHQYLESVSPKRLVVFSEKSQVMFYLPAISETYNELAVWGSNVLESTDSFYDYMMYAETDGILVEDQHLLIYEHGRNLLTELAERGALEIEYTSGNYVLMRVSEADGQAKQDVLQYIYDIVNNTQ